MIEMVIMTMTKWSYEVLAMLVVKVCLVVIVGKMVIVKPVSMVAR